MVGASYVDWMGNVYYLDQDGVAVNAYFEVRGYLDEPCFAEFLEIVRMVATFNKETKKWYLNFRKLMKLTKDYQLRQTFKQKVKGFINMCGWKTVVLVVKNNGHKGWNDLRYIEGFFSKDEIPQIKKALEKAGALRSREKSEEKKEEQKDEEREETKAEEAEAKGSTEETAKAIEITEEDIKKFIEYTEAKITTLKCDESFEGLERKEWCTGKREIEIKKGEEFTILVAEEDLPKLKEVADIIEVFEVRPKTTNGDRQGILKVRAKATKDTKAVIELIKEKTEYIEDEWNFDDPLEIERNESGNETTFVDEETLVRISVNNAGIWLVRWVSKNLEENKKYECYYLLKRI